MLPSDYQFHRLDDRPVTDIATAEESRSSAVRTAILIVAANVAALAALILSTS
jgi:hypothetical protein